VRAAAQNGTALLFLAGVLTRCLLRSSYASCCCSSGCSCASSCCCRARRAVAAAVAAARPGAVAERVLLLQLLQRLQLRVLLLLPTASMRAAAQNGPAVLFLAGVLTRCLAARGFCSVPNIGACLVPPDSCGAAIFFSVVSGKKKKRGGKGMSRL
jgi:hypothetical protein